MVVKFIDPIITGIYNPTVNPADFKMIPPVPGVYIYGICIPITNNDVTQDKFCPLYVGTAKSLQKRISDHYNEEKTNGKSQKEL